MDSTDDPEWIAENEAIRERKNLPPYSPPRFIDRTYVYEVRNELETEYRCDITILGVNPTYPDDWQVYVNGEPSFEIGRFRNDDGNTVYNMTSEEFVSLVRNYLEE